MRLLTEQRREEQAAFLQLYQSVRSREGWRAEPGLPEVPATHPHARIWRSRAGRFRIGIKLVRGLLGGGPWRVLDVGAGCCWAAARLAEMGHRVVAVDVNLDLDDGLLAANRLVNDPACLNRAEADMEALPLEDGSFDLVLAAAVIHYSRDLVSTLSELHRVTDEGGVLLVLDSPVYAERRDGDAMVKAQKRGAHRAESDAWVSSYLVRDEIEGIFARAGWSMKVHGWPGRPREVARDLIEIARHGRRTARFPILIARRNG